MTWLLAVPKRGSINNDHDFMDIFESHPDDISKSGENSIWEVGGRKLKTAEWDLAGNTEHPGILVKIIIVLTAGSDMRASVLMWSSASILGMALYFLPFQFFTTVTLVITLRSVCFCENCVIHVIHLCKFSIIWQWELEIGRAHV